MILPVLAWVDVGHMLVSRIAEEHLSKNDPVAYSDFSNLVVSFNKLTDGRSNTFVESAVWADDIKNNGATLFNPYHYIDRIYDPDGLMPILKDKNKDINVVNTLGWVQTILKNNKGFISFERAMMARFLMNLVGEIHQPLNNVQMFNTTKAYLNGDGGGLFINLTTATNKTVNLHDFVDSGAEFLQSIGSASMLPRPLSSSGLQLLDQMTGAITAEFPLETFGDLPKILNPNTWSLESYQEAVTTIYPFVQNHKAVTGDWANQVALLTRRKIALAGYRLANMISSVFAAK